MNGLETRMLAAAENQTRHLRNISENLERLVDLLEKRFEEDPVMAREEQFEKALAAVMDGRENKKPDPVCNKHGNEPEQPKDEFTRPCPVCKTTEHLEVEVHDLCWTVCCNKCYKVRGPYCNDRETAIAAWNSDKE